MKTLYLLALVVAVFIAYYGFALYQKIQISKKLTAQSRPFENLSSDYTKTLLVLGDSTATGVGAYSPADSVAGRLAAFTNATFVENRAVSGAVVANLPAQIAGARLQTYSYILVEIGANDIIRLHNAEESAQTLGETLLTLPRANKVIVMTAGNVGAATLLPWFVRPLYTWVTRLYDEKFSEFVRADGDTFVSLYIAPHDDPFVKNPGKYFAADGFHPSSDGYALWFREIQKFI